jgi:hypothetical protein
VSGFGTSVFKVVLISDSWLVVCNSVIYTCKLSELYLKVENQSNLYVLRKGCDRPNYSNYSIVAEIA